MAAGDMKNTTPAVLLYYEDFLAGTADMTDEEVGQYIRLLCYQNSKGHLSDGYIKRVMPNALAYVLEKFTADEEGAQFNERMEAEIKRRVKYSKSRAENSSKKNNQKTCVYLMADPSNGLIKIGSSNKPERRLLEVQNAIGNRDIYLVAYCEGVPQKVEKELHDKYREKCAYLEWYALAPSDMDDIIAAYHMKKHMKAHMGTETETETETVNINKSKRKELLHPEWA